jgi:transglutaminase-like putative cysteine protease
LASPAVLPATSQRTFTATVTVGELTSRLLPVPPTAESVTGAVRAEVTSIGAVASRPSASGERYRVTAIVPPAVSAATNPSASPSLTATQLQGDLALPPEPAIIASLARTVTATATTPLTRAEALVNWFRSGLFRYTLTPPVAPAGANALTVFLTTTRAGTCESFAGAFAVMARSLGLPTRVAVGFTGGRSSSSGTTIVSGADAHAWPEVYLGAASGWVSFEPTPELPSGELSPADRGDAAHEHPDAPVGTGLTDDQSAAGDADGSYDHATGGNQEDGCRTASDAHRRRWHRRRRRRSHHRYPHLGCDPRLVAPETPTGFGGATPASIERLLRGGPCSG